jgi:ribosomal-protein-alanine N-acetyltransferase
VVEALVADDIASASRLAGVTFPTPWPSHPEARAGLPWHMRAMMEDSRQLAWRIRVIVEQDTQYVIGSINLKGLPKQDGDVEIGWGVEPEHQRRGFAFEAAIAVAHWIWAQPHVRTLSATIAPDNEVSKRLAAKLGMRLVPGETRRDLPLWRSPLQHG